MSASRGLRRWFASLLPVGSLAAFGLFLAPVAQADTLSLDVTFSTGGGIVVTLPNGTPVGVSGGSPTVIPAGYYTLFLTGPGGCTNVPYFTLRGPGVDITDNLESGEVTNDSYSADFQANSTYTWTDQNSPTVYTFQTNANVLGSPTSQPTSGYAVNTQGNSSTASSSDVVGSASAGGSHALKGTLSAAVSAAGKLSLTLKGKRVTILPAGRYAVALSDKSAKSGFVLGLVKHTPLTLAAKGPVGSRTTTVNLTAGQWFYAPRAQGTKTYFAVTG
jgi:hypothetical protein